MPDDLTPPAAPATPPAAPATPPATPPTPPAAPPATPPNEPAETPPQPNPVPEKYELKLPKDSLLNAEHVKEAEAFAKANKLPNDVAQALLERENATIAAYVESQKKQFEQSTKEWVEQMKADKEIGGDAFPQNAELAKRVVARFGSEPLKQALNDTGLGNHPELVKMLVQIGKAMSPDGFVLPGSSPGAPKSMEDKFYPSHSKE